MIKVLFVCIHNSARSQMAEELLRKMVPDAFEAESAGIEPGNLNPFAVEVLKEAGIDITGKKTCSIKRKLEQGKQYDYVVAVCDEANAERCPNFPLVKKQIHWEFEDPSQLKGTWEEKLSKTRQIRDQIKEKLEQWLKELKVSANEDIK